MSYHYSLPAASYTSFPLWETDSKELDVSGNVVTMAGQCISALMTQGSIGIGLKTLFQ